MSRTFRGGCICGAVRYEVTGEPVAMLDCQCRDCQRESGTGHSSHLTFQDATVQRQGEVAEWDTRGEQGTLKRRAFCPRCGAPLYMTFPDMPAFFVVRAGSLDDPGLYRPQMVTWTASAQPWDRLDHIGTAFSRMPTG